MADRPGKAEALAEGADECPACCRHSVSMTSADSKFIYGTGSNAVELSCAVPVHRCRECGFEFTDGKAEKARDLAVRRHLGVITAERIRSLRKSYGLSRREFGALTRIGEASLARWESGEIIQSFGYDQFLYLLTFPENLRRLRERFGGSEVGPKQAAFDEDALRAEPAPEGAPPGAVSDLAASYSAGKPGQEPIEPFEESKLASKESQQARYRKAHEPVDRTSISGRILMRLPKYLHRKLREVAGNEGVSVNQYLVALVAEGISRSELEKW